MRSTCEVGCFTDKVNASDQASKLLQLIEVIEFGRPAAAAGINGETKWPGMEQSLTVNRQRRHNGNFLLREFLCKCVLFVNCGVAPASGPVKFHHDVVIVFEADFVHAVFVTVQRQETPIAYEAQFVERLEYVIGLKPGESEGTVVGVCHQLTLAGGWRIMMIITLVLQGVTVTGCTDR